jgi:hypothetical protein
MKYLLQRCETYTSNYNSDPSYISLMVIPLHQKNLELIKFIVEWSKQFDTIERINSIRLNSELETWYFDGYDIGLDSDENEPLDLVYLWNGEIDPNGVFEFGDDFFAILEKLGFKQIYPEYHEIFITFGHGHTRKEKFIAVEGLFTDGRDDYKIWTDTSLDTAIEGEQ